MILYFDSLITDTPFNKSFVDPNKWVRNSCAAYAMPKKVDIAKYSLASYATYPWSHVLIRFELEDTSRTDEFESYARSLFPNAIIMRTRSANQAEYRKSLALMEKWDDDWIWYAPNNDHPIMTHDLSIIDELLDIAKQYAGKHPHVSIPYSHFSEYNNYAKKGSPFWYLFGQGTKLVEDTKNATIFTVADGDNTAIQIVNKNLFRTWFDSVEMGDARIYRSEDVRKFFLVHNQLLIVPKREIAVHFDGYSHTIGGLAEIDPRQVPPLFIPEGFFTNTIKIRYGYETYDAHATNVYPGIKPYSFVDDTHGTDYKASIETLPYFWKTRIISTDTSPRLKPDVARQGLDREHAIRANPYTLVHKPFSVATLFYIARHAREKLRAIFR